MRRHQGVSGLQRQAKQREEFQRAGNALAQQQLQDLESKLVQFKTNLEEFARKYRQDINRDPVFRMHFQRMCTNIGVDPLSSNKGYWNEILGFGDFYYELGVQIAQVCLATREKNGGLIELSELKDQVERLRGKSSQEISEDDIIRSIKAMRPLGNGFGVIKVGDRSFVQSVPRELDVDLSTVLGLAQESLCHLERGCVNENEVCDKFGWDHARAKRVLDDLVKEGMSKDVSDSKVIIYSKSLPPFNIDSSSQSDPNIVDKLNSTHLLATLNTPLISIFENGSNVYSDIFPSIHAPYRIITESTVLDFNNTQSNTGLEAHVLWFLNRIPDGVEFGKYLACCGGEIRGIDAILYGVGTHFIPDDRISSFIERIQSSESSDLRYLNSLVDNYTSSAPSKADWINFLQKREFIRRCFKFDKISEILAALKKEDSTNELVKSAIESLESSYSLEKIQVILRMMKKMRNDEKFGKFSDGEKWMDFRSSLEFGFRVYKKLNSEQEPLSEKKIEEIVNSAAKDTKETDLAFLNNRTFTDYIHRTATSIVSIEDVMRMVTGDTKASGSFLLTAQELISWFDENWGTIMDPNDLDFISVIESNEHGGGKYIKELDHEINLDRMGWMKNIQPWGVRQRVEAILEVRCEKVGAVLKKKKSEEDGTEEEEEEVYLKWRD